MTILFISVLTTLLFTIFAVELSDPAHETSQIEENGITFESLTKVEDQNFDLPVSQTIWLFSGKTYPEEIILKSPCLGGYQAYGPKKCQDREDCPPLFSCQSRRCCLANVSNVSSLTCPSRMVPTANKLCQSDQDCALGECYQTKTKLVNPEVLTTQRIIDDSDLEQLVGICCSSSDIVPTVVAKCPKGYTSIRYDPCGVTFPECKLGSFCMITEDAFGKCCLPESSVVEIGSKGHFGPGAYHRGYFRSPWGRGRRRRGRRRGKGRKRGRGRRGKKGRRSRHRDHFDEDHRRGYGRGNTAFNRGSGPSFAGDNHGSIIIINEGRDGPGLRFG